MTLLRKFILDWGSLRYLLLRLVAGQATLLLWERISLKEKVSLIIGHYGLTASLVALGTMALGFGAHFFYPQENYLVWQAWATVLTVSLGVALVSVGFLVLNHMIFWLFGYARRHR